MDIAEERENITKFDPEEQKYCSGLLDEIEQHQWIPIAERPPKAHKIVQGAVNGRIRDCYYNDGSYYIWCANAWCVTTDITHWKPIILPTNKN